MVFRVYIDVIFIINAITNYMALCSTAMICGAPEKRGRIITAATLGGIYATLTYMFNILNFIWIKILIAFLMVLISFGARKLFRMTLGFFGVSAAFAGIALAVNLLMNGEWVSGDKIPFTSLAISVSLSYLILLMVFNKSALGVADKTVVPMEITYNEKTIKINALIDTGNTLCDPMTNTRVAVVDFDVISEFFAREECELILRMREEEAILALPEKFRLIPYKTIESSAFLLAFKPDKITIDNKVKNLLIAICKNKISDGGAYSALVGAAEG